MIKAISIDNTCKDILFEVAVDICDILSDSAVIKGADSIKEPAFIVKYMAEESLAFILFCIISGLVGF